MIIDLIFDTAPAIIVGAWLILASLLKGRLPNAVSETGLWYEKAFSAVINLVAWVYVTQVVYYLDSEWYLIPAALFTIVGIYPEYNPKGTLPTEWVHNVAAGLAFASLYTIYGQWLEGGLIMVIVAVILSAIVFLLKPKRTILLIQILNLILLTGFNIYNTLNYYGTT